MADDNKGAYRNVDGDRHDAPGAPSPPPASPPDPPTTAQVRTTVPASLVQTSTVPVGAGPSGPATAAPAGTQQGVRAAGVTSEIELMRGLQAVVQSNTAVAHEIKGMTQQATVGVERTARYAGATDQGTGVG